VGPFFVTDLVVVAALAELLVGTTQLYRTGAYPVVFFSAVGLGMYQTKPALVRAAAFLDSKARGDNDE